MRAIEDRLKMFADFAEGREAQVEAIAEASALTLDLVSSLLMSNRNPGVADLGELLEHTYADVRAFQSRRLADVRAVIAEDGEQHEWV